MFSKSTLKNAKLLILASGFLLGVLLNLQSAKAAQTCECDDGLATTTINITGGANTWQECNNYCKGNNHQRFRFASTSITAWQNTTNATKTPTEICIESGGTGLNAGGRCIGCEANGKVTGAGAGSVCQTKADYDDATLVGTPNEGGSYPVVTTTAAAPLNTNYKLLESFPGFFKADTVMTNFPALVLAIYKFGIWTVGIAGLFMLTIGGFMYMASAGNKSSASSAKGIMTDAIVGIVGALTAYLFLYVINPDLTVLNLNFTPVDVTVVESEDISVTGSVSGSLGSKDGVQMDASFVASLNKLKQNGINTVVTSGLRSLDKQKALIAQNCGGYPATGRCTPPTCLLKNGPASCPHTTGKAIDVWALNPSGLQAISQKACMSNIASCFNNPSQKALIAAMKSEGFCVLSSEPWHFEKPKMSAACS